MKDGKGREVDYLRIAVTDRCNQKCRYCMPEGAKFFAPTELLTDEQIIKIVTLLAKEGVKKVRLTGGEPLLREGLPQLVSAILAIEGIEDLSLTTNGTLLAEHAKALYDAGLRRLNISLDSLDESVYRFLTRGGQLKPVLEGIALARKIGFSPIKVNMTLAAGVNDHLIETMISSLPSDIELRLIELMPIGSQASWSKKHHLSVYKHLGGDRQLQRISSIEKGSSSVSYRHLPSGRIIGLIQPFDKEMCQNCGRIRITADGRLKTCLHSSTELDLKPLLNQEKLLTQSVKAILMNKLPHNSLSSAKHKPIKRSMNTIGG